jgi:hypothetical protein
MHKTVGSFDSGDCNEEPKYGRTNEEISGTRDIVVGNDTSEGDGEADKSYGK